MPADPSRDLPGIIWNDEVSPCAGGSAPEFLAEAPRKRLPLTGKRAPGQCLAPGATAQAGAPWQDENFGMRGCRTATAWLARLNQEQKT